MNLTEVEKLEVYHKYITGKMEKGKIGDIKILCNISDETTEQLKKLSDLNPNKK